MKDKIDFSIKYGNLKIVKELPILRLPSGQTNRVLECVCDCGKTTKVRWLHLKRKRISSCGCLQKTKKGKSNSCYGILLNSMKTRCKENYFERHLYFDKGIKVCQEWLNDIDVFIEFCDKNGYRKGLQIDRIDGNKGYNPDNCRFVTSKENANNRFNTLFVVYKSEKISLKMLLQKLGKENNYNSIIARIKRGVNHDEAIDKPIRKGNYCKDNFKNRQAV